MGGAFPKTMKRCVDQMQCFFVIGNAAAVQGHHFAGNIVCSNVSLLLNLYLAGTTGYLSGRNTTCVRKYNKRAYIRAYSQ